MEGGFLLASWVQVIAVRAAKGDVLELISECHAIVGVAL